MKLIEGVFFPFLIEVFMNVKGICGPVSEVDDWVGVNVLWKEIIHVGVSEGQGDRPCYLGSWHPAQFNIKL